MQPVVDGWPSRRRDLVGAFAALSPKVVQFRAALHLHLARPGPASVFLQHGHIRTQLLAEFKSRSFTPPADSEQCRKDDLTSSVCSGGVRVNWDEVNGLLKQKLLFADASCRAHQRGAL